MPGWLFILLTVSVLIPSMAIPAVLVATRQVQPYTGVRLFMILYGFGCLIVVIGDLTVWSDL